MQILKKRTHRAKQEKACDRPDIHIVEAGLKKIAMGILPNVNIKVLQKFPSYVLQMGKSQFAVDKELAGRVFVRAA